MFVCFSVDSANMAGLPDVTTGPDITAANFSEHFPDGNMPGMTWTGSSTHKYHSTQLK